MRNHAFSLQLTKLFRCVWMFKLYPYILSILIGSIRRIQLWRNQMMDILMIRNVLEY